MQTQTNLLESLTASPPSRDPIPKPKFETGQADFQNLLMTAIQVPAPRRPEFNSPDNRADFEADQKIQDPPPSSRQETRSIGGNESRSPKPGTEQRADRSEPGPGEAGKSPEAETRPSVSETNPASSGPARPDKTLTAAGQNPDTTVNPGSPSYNNLLKLLSGQETVNSLFPGGTADTDSIKQLLGLLKDGKNQALDFLAQSGMNPVKAKNLIREIQSALENKIPTVQGMNLDLNLLKLSRLVQAGTTGGSTAGDAAMPPLSTSPGAKPPVPAAEDFSPVEVKVPPGELESLRQFGQKQGPLNDALIRLLNSAGPRPENPQPPVTGGVPVIPEALRNARVIQVNTEGGINVSGLGDSAAKPVAAVNPVLPQAPVARGTTEKTVMNQILEKMSLQRAGSRSEIFLKLDPPSLGSVRMNVSTIGDSVKATVIAENQTVKQIIEHNLNQLRDSLLDQGLEVESFTVHVGGGQGQKGNPMAGGGPGTPAFPGGEGPALDPIPQDMVSDPPRRAFVYESQSISLFA